VAVSIVDSPTSRLAGHRLALQVRKVVDSQNEQDVDLNSELANKFTEQFVNDSFRPTEC
jgi:hypothetical protein